MLVDCRKKTILMRSKLYTDQMSQNWLLTWGNCLAWYPYGWSFCCEWTLSEKWVGLPTAIRFWGWIVLSRSWTNPPMRGQVVPWPSRWSHPPIHTTLWSEFQLLLALFGRILTQYVIVGVLFWHILTLWQLKEKVNSLVWPEIERLKVGIKS